MQEKKRNTHYLLLQHNWSLVNDYFHLDLAHYFRVINGSQGEELQHCYDRQWSDVTWHTKGFPHPGKPQRNRALPVANSLCNRGGWDLDRARSKDGQAPPCLQKKFLLSTRVWVVKQGVGQQLVPKEGTVALPVWLGRSGIHLAESNGLSKLCTHRSWQFCPDGALVRKCWY